MLYTKIWIFFIALFVYSFVGAQNVNNLSCNPNPCRNSGKCLTQNQQNVCQCPAGFVGSLCQYVDPCNPSQCQNGGTCSVVSTNDAQSPLFNCSCPIGYTASLCEITIPNACDGDPCKNHGTCQLLTLDHFTCICPNGFQGETCETVDYCAPKPCKNGGICSPKVDGYQCKCASGFVGTTCTEDVDECTSTKPCVNGNCINVHGSYRCECRQGYDGKNCDQVYQPCNPSPCENGGQCVVINPFTFRCQCPQGFSGQKCDVNVDDCVGHQCKNGGRCIDGVKNYTCECPKNWKGQYCTVDVDECAGQANVCQNGGTCSNSIGGFLCVCVNGWEGEFCQINHDDCIGTKCYNGGTCHDRVASFSCECPVGYTGLLCHLRDACMSSPCQGALCDTNPVDGSYVCSCPRGFRGVDCSEDIDECANGNPCEHGGSCVNTPGSYRCNCALAWTGPFCDQNINECASSPCQNEATCLDDIGKFTCVCMPGYTGINCEKNIDECASKPCLNGGVCRDLVNNFTCACQRGFSGVNCEKNVDECAKKPCLNGGVCRDLVNAFACSCPTGFTGTNCEKTVDACSNKPCLNGGVCRVFGSRFTCACQRGFIGEKCERNVDICASEPCLNGGVCRALTNNFTCSCQSGFAGSFCEKAAVTVVNTLPPTTIDIHAYDVIDESDRKICLENSCSPKSNDGICDSECNYPACGYDGTDCSAGLNPFSNCVMKDYCVHVFKDGKCDSICNVESCLFDGFDCLDKSDLMCNPLYSTYCIRHLGDGNCDSGCNTRGCNYDGGDCSGTKDNRNVLGGAVALVLTVEPEVFANRSQEFLMTLGKILDVNLHIKMDDKNRPMVYRWNSKDGVESREPIPILISAKNARIKRQNSATIIYGIFVVLVVDVTKCTLDGRTDCFSKIDSVANFMGAPKVSDQLKEQLGLKWNIYSATPEEATIDSSLPKTVWIASVIVLLVMIFLVLFVLERKRKIVSKLWNIPGSSSASSQSFCRSTHCRSSLEKSSVFAVPNFYESDLKEPSSRRIPYREDTPECGRSCSGQYSQFDYQSYLNTSSQDSDQGSVSDAYSETALILGIRCCRSDAVRTMLVSGADPNETDSKGNGALHHAVNINNVEYVSMILHDSTVSVDVEAKNIDGCTPLILASKAAPGNCAVLETLLIAKASTSAQDNEGKSALHWSAVQNDVEAILCLLKYGANKDATNQHDQTPLFFAVKEGHLEATKLLLERGASKDMADDMDRTPLHLAEERGFKEIAEVLIDSRLNLSVLGLESSTVGGGTLPHNVGRQKPKPPKRTKSLKEAVKSPNNNNNNNNELIASAGHKPVAISRRNSPPHFVKYETTLVKSPPDGSLMIQQQRKQNSVSSRISPPQTMSYDTSPAYPTVLDGSPAYPTSTNYFSAAGGGGAMFSHRSPPAAMDYLGNVIETPTEFVPSPPIYGQGSNLAAHIPGSTSSSVYPTTTSYFTGVCGSAINNYSHRSPPETFSSHQSPPASMNYHGNVIDAPTEFVPSPPAYGHMNHCAHVPPGSTPTVVGRPARQQQQQNCQKSGGGYTHYTTPNSVPVYDYADYFAIDPQQQQQYVNNGSVQI